MYPFSTLKELVKRRFGVDPDQVQSTFRPIEVQLQYHELKDLEFTDDGIYYKKDGKRYKGFLYIKKGFNPVIARQNNYKTTVPKFHILNCKTIYGQKKRKNFNGHYVFANKTITMKDEIDGRIKELLLCKNCMNDHPDCIMKELNTTQYIEKFVKNSHLEGNFEEDDIPKEIKLDAYGYTPDWDQRSRDYRMRKKFTCENCHIALNKSYGEGYYVETHHISGIKTDNRDENLKC